MCVPSHGSICWRFWTFGYLLQIKCVRPRNYFGRRGLVLDCWWCFLFGGYEITYYCTYRVSPCSFSVCIILLLLVYYYEGEKLVDSSSSGVHLPHSGADTIWMISLLQLKKWLTILKKSIWKTLLFPFVYFFPEVLMSVFFEIYRAYSICTGLKVYAACSVH